MAGEAASCHPGRPLIFGFGSEQDAKNSKETIAAAYQGGLSLPDRDYYLKEDAKSKEIRDKYLTHLSKMLQLAGDPAALASTAAKTILDMETALAKASLTRVERRDPYKTTKNSHSPICRSARPTSNGPTIEVPRAFPA